MPKQQVMCRLEDTLIDMYLSGYPNQTAYAAASDMTMPADTNGTDKLNAPPHGW